MGNNNVIPQIFYDDNIDLNTIPEAQVAQAKEKVLNYMSNYIGNYGYVEHIEKMPKVFMTYEILNPILDKPKVTSIPFFKKFIKDYPECVELFCEIIDKKILGELYWFTEIAYFGDSSAVSKKDNEEKNLAELISKVYLQKVGYEKKHLHYKCKHLGMKYVLDYLKSKNIEYDFSDFIGKWNSDDFLQLVDGKALYICANDNGNVIGHISKMNDYIWSWTWNTGKDPVIIDTKENTINYFFKHLWRENDKNCNLFEIELTKDSIVEIDKMYDSKDKNHHLYIRTNELKVNQKTMIFLPDKTIDYYAWEMTGGTYKFDKNRLVKNLGTKRYAEVINYLIKKNNIDKHTFFTSLMTDFCIFIDHRHILEMNTDFKCDVNDYINYFNTENIQLHKILTYMDLFLDNLKSDIIKYVVNSSNDVYELLFKYYSNKGKSMDLFSAKIFEQMCKLKNIPININLFDLMGKYEGVNVIEKYGMKCPELMEQ